MVKKINGETWQPIRFAGDKTMRNKYAISSHGRAASYKEDIHEDGKLLAGSLTSGYKTLNLHIDGKNRTLYFHREVAKAFKKKDSPKQKIVIHINHDKTDNNIKNLKWAAQHEANAHQQKSPKKLAYKKLQTERTKGLKLTVTQVKAIKKILENPKRKLTNQQVADNFNVSTMTIYRIKRGENWGRI